VAGRRARLGTIAAVAGLLLIHYALAAHSLSLENPTVDEVVHMPAGVSYWQKGTFRLYHHNPPLVKLVAALPVVWSQPNTDLLYQSNAWRSRDPSQATFAELFTRFNADRYFELFQRARLSMPLFSIIGGLAVFAWSRRLYGAWGGLLSLALWVFCPNILAHARLITSDLGSTALGVAATYLFWRYLHHPGRRSAAIAGIALGFAQLTKFSMLLLFVVWPFLWLARLLLTVPKPDRRACIVQSAMHGVLIVATSILVIDAGYLFEGVGIPVGDFEFGSKSLTRPVRPGMDRPRSKNLLLEATWQFRINRFRGSWLGRIPCPLPEHYMLGFDEQKIETEGLPRRFARAVSIADEADRARAIEQERSIPESSAEVKDGYPVYLNGELRREGGWWYYYLCALAYKVPEGTWFLIILALASLRLVRRSSAEWADEIALAAVPVVVLVAMSWLTDINLGLRYVLAVFPYLFIAAGRLVPLASGLAGPRKWVMAILVVAPLGSTMAATAQIHPHYLAYFNWASGGPDQAPARLIDSNLDWGQDLIALQKWWKETIPGQRLGFAYFGQINPSIFKLRGERFDWFLPPVRPRSTVPLAPRPDPMLVGPAKRLTPGYYAVSATLVYGLPWRLYDPAPPDTVLAAWGPAWNVRDLDAFWYFRQFAPERRIGHSIYIYHLSEDDVAGAMPIFLAREPR
jgi:hypothetical protein